MLSRSTDLGGWKMTIIILPKTGNWLRGIDGQSWPCRHTRISDPERSACHSTDNTIQPSVCQDQNQLSCTNRQLWSKQVRHFGLMQITSIIDRQKAAYCRIRSDSQTSLPVPDNLIDEDERQYILTCEVSRNKNKHVKEIKHVCL